MLLYVYTKKGKTDGVGEIGEKAEPSDKHPLDFLLLHGYVQLEEQVMSGALASPEAKGAIDSPKRVKPMGATK
jgi:hypothetical protein